MTQIQAVQILLTVEQEVGHLQFYDLSPELISRNIPKLNEETLTKNKVGVLGPLKIFFCY